MSQDKIKRLAIVTSSGSALALVPAVAQAESVSSSVNSVQPENVAKGSLQDNIKLVINAMLLIIGIVSVIMLIIGGFRYVLSAGNEKAITGAKDTILYAIIGVVIALISFAVVNFVLGQFGA